MIQILENLKTIREEVWKELNIEYIYSPFPDDRIKGVILDTRVIDIDLYKNLSVISRVGVGIDNIDLEKCRERNIKVFTTPCDELIDAVAEFTIFQIIKFLREYTSPRKNLSDLQVGIIGVGRIGWHVNFILTEGFLVSTFIYDINKRGYFGRRFTDKGKLLRESDIICVHVSGNREVINKEDIAVMKSNAIVVNMARAGCINAEGISSALIANKLGGYISDVDDHHRFIIRNVLCTPHIASDTYGARRAMENLAVKNLIKGLKGDL